MKLCSTTNIGKQEGNKQKEMLLVKNFLHTTRGNCFLNLNSEKGYKKQFRQLTMQDLD